MSEETLADLLERAANRHAVGSPPIEAVMADERRSQVRRNGFLALAAAVLVGAVIAGTTWLFNPGESASPAEPAPDVVINLEGRWVLTALNDGDGKPAIDPEQFDMPNVTFSNPEVTIGKCPFTAEYSQSGERGSDLRFSADSGFVVRLDASCPAEKALFSSLDRIRHVSEANSVLSLLAEDMSLIATLERVAAKPINIEGAWVLTALTDAEGRSLLAIEGKTSRPVLTFADGRIQGVVMSCDTITGSYSQPSSADLRFDVKSATLSLGKPCNPPPTAERLSEVRHVSEANGKLQLHDENWMIIAVLERAVGASPDSGPAPCKSLEFEGNAYSRAFLPEGTEVRVGREVGRAQGVGCSGPAGGDIPVYELAPETLAGIPDADAKRYIVLIPDLVGVVGPLAVYRVALW